MKKDTVKKYIWILVAVIVYAVIANISLPGDLSVEGQRAIALMVAAVIIWSTEVVPVGFASIALPMLTGVLGICSLGSTLSNFMSTTIIFMISSQLIAQAFVKTGVGQRVGLKISFVFGGKPKHVLLAFMLATGVISMFLVDIPTAIIFAGIAYSLLEQNGCKPGQSKYGMAMMIGIPIAAAIGGFATPVGSGLNQLAIGQLKAATGITINFAQWCMVGVPMALILLFAAWFIITKALPAEIDKVAGADTIKEQSAAMGKLSTDEKKFIAIFAVTVLLWVTNPLTTYGYKYWKMFDMTKIGLIVSVVWIVLLFVFMVAANSLGLYPMA